MKRFFRLAFCVVLAAMVIFGAQPAGAAQKNPWPFVVMVTEEYKGIPWSIGSGFVFNRDQGLIVTARHAFFSTPDDVHKVKVLINTNSVTDEFKEYDASVVWQHETADIGLLKISPEAMKNAVEAPIGYLPPIGNNMKIVGFQGDRIFNGGIYRLRFAKNERQKIVCQREVSLRYVGVSGVMSSFGELRLIAEEGQGDCRGLSGGVLLNEKDEAIGVLSGTITGFNAFLFFCPSLMDIPMEYWLRRK